MIRPLLTRLARAMGYTPTTEHEQTRGVLAVTHRYMSGRIEALMAELSSAGENARRLDRWWNEAKAGRDEAQCENADLRTDRDRLSRELAAATALLQKSNEWISLKESMHHQAHEKAAAAIAASEQRAALYRQQMQEASRRADVAEKDYAACAHAIGIEYVQDMGPSYPGPVEAVIAAIDKARRGEDAEDDLRTQLAAAVAERDAALEREAGFTRAWDREKEAREQAEAKLARAERETAELRKRPRMLPAVQVREVAIDDDALDEDHDAPQPGEAGRDDG